MKLKIWIACLCAVLGTVACSGAPVVDRTQFQPVIRIALMGAFSGAAAYAGSYQQHSLDFEVARINAGGGLLGHRLEVVAADDEGKTAKAASLVRQLAADPATGLLVGPSTTATLQAVKPEVAGAAIPQCLPGSIADGEMSGAPFTFRTQVSDQGSAASLLAALTRQQPSMKQVGLLAEESPDGRFYDSILPAAAKRAGVAYVGAGFVTDRAADQQSQVQDLVAKGARAIVLSGDPVVAAGTAQAVDRAGQTGKLQLLGPADLGSSQYIDAGGPAAVGTIFASAIQAYRTSEPDWSWPAAYRGFVRAVTARYGFSPQDSEMQGTPSAAGCVADWAAAVGKAGSFAGRPVASAWQTLNIPPSESVLGVAEHFSASNHDAIPDGAIFVYQWVASGDRRGLRKLAGP